MQQLTGLLTRQRQLLSALSLLSTLYSMNGFNIWVGVVLMAWLIPEIIVSAQMIDKLQVC